MDPESIDLGDLPIHKGPAGYAILNVADDYPAYSHPRDMLYIHAGLCDGPEDWEADWGEDNSLYAYFHALSALRFLADGPWEVMVHCHGGVSRSCFVVACYMAWLLDIDYYLAKAMLHRLYEREHIHPKHDRHDRFVPELINLLDGV